MRALALISLLSAAVVVQAEPEIVTKNVALTTCTGSNVGTNCAALATSWSHV